MKDIQAQFLGRFTETARKRIERMHAALEDTQTGISVLIHELHSLAGESGLLGFSQFVGIARTGETEAKRMQNEGGSSAQSLRATVVELERMLDELSPR